MGVGVGEAVLNPVAVSLIGDLFVRERRATPTSVFFSAQTLGGSLSFLLVATIVAVWSGNQLGASPELAAVAPWRVALFLIGVPRSEAQTSELQSLMRISYAVFCLKKKTYTKKKH